MYSDPIVYSEELILRSRVLNLSQTSFWKNILYYRTNFWGQTISEIDSLEYFLSTNGKYDPQSELEATLISFLSSESNKIHPQCRFPARYKWLKEQLRFDSNLLIEKKCPQIDHWQKEMKLNDVYVVFVSYLEDQLSTHFGEIILRLFVQDLKKNEKFIYALDFSKKNSSWLNNLIGRTENQVQFYKYTDKINQLEDSQKREFWQYKVKLSREELDWFWLHLYEIQETNFNYYTIDENNSYRLSYLMNIANPRMNIIEHLNFWFITPHDAIKSLLKNSDELDHKQYYPAANNKSPSTAPEATHEYYRASFQKGYSNLGGFLGLQFRYGYHDLLNSGIGHFNYTELQFLNFNVRKYDKKNSWNLETLNLFSYASYKPYSLDKSISYRMDIGVDSSMHKKDYKFLYRDALYLSSTPAIEGGTGLLFYKYFTDLNLSLKPQKIHPINLDFALGISYQTQQLEWNNLLISVLGGVRIQYLDVFAYNYRYAPTTNLNILWKYGNWKVQLFGGFFYYLNEKSSDYQLSFRLRYSLHTNHEVRLEYKTQMYFQEYFASYHLLF